MFGKLGSGGRLESLLDRFRLMVPEDMSAQEAPAPESMLPWRWWELPKMWWELLPASYIPEEKTGAPGTFPFRKSSLIQDYVAGLEFRICRGFETGWGSGGQVIVPVRTCLTRYSSVSTRKSRPFPVFFRYFRVLNLLLAPQPLAGCVRQPPPLLPRTGSRTEIRVEPGRVRAWEFRLAEATSECPRIDHSSTVCISRGWEWSAGPGSDLRISSTDRTAGLW